MLLSISHELRTPLHGVSVSARLVLTYHSCMHHRYWLLPSCYRTPGWTIAKLLSSRPYKHVGPLLSRRSTTCLTSQSSVGTLELVGLRMSYSTVGEFTRSLDRGTLLTLYHSVDLMQLLEDATEGCWIGHRARMFTSEIGSVYSPPKADRNSITTPQPTKYVETVLDIGHVDTVSVSPSAT